MDYLPGTVLAAFIDVDVAYRVVIDCAPLGQHDVIGRQRVVVSFYRYDVGVTLQQNLGHHALLEVIGVFPVVGCYVQKVAPFVAIILDEYVSTFAQRIQRQRSDGLRQQFDARIYGGYAHGHATQPQSVGLEKLCVVPRYGSALFGLLPSEGLAEHCCKFLKYIFSLGHLY